MTHRSIRSLILTALVALAALAAIPWSAAAQQASPAACPPLSPEAIEALTRVRSSSLLSTTWYSTLTPVRSSIQRENSLVFQSPMVSLLSLTPIVKVLEPSWKGSTTRARGPT